MGKIQPCTFQPDINYSTHLAMPAFHRNNRTLRYQPFRSREKGDWRSILPVRSLEDLRANVANVDQTILITRRAACNLGALGALSCKREGREQVKVDTLDANGKSDQAKELVNNLVAALGSLSRSTLILDALGGSSTSDDVLGRKSGGHDGEGDESDDVLELHFDFLFCGFKD